MTIAATSAWGLVKETAAAVSVVTIWRQEPAWSAPSAKMVSCQFSYLQTGLNVFIPDLLRRFSRGIKRLCVDLLVRSAVNFLHRLGHARALNWTESQHEKKKKLYDLFHSHLYLFFANR